MNRKLLAVLCGVLLIGVFFVSCQKKTAQQTTGPAPMEIVIGNGANPRSLDPSQITGVPEHRIVLALYEGLVGYDPQTANSIPGVAESWTYSQNNTVITFKIRQGITWSDGTPITAQTLVDSWLHHLNPTTASEYAYMMGMVVKGAELYNEGGGSPSDVAIRAVDSSTFEVTLVGPAAYALDMMAHYAFMPLPMHAIQRHGANWTRPENFVGNGPFVLQEYTPNSQLVVVPNDRYWNKANVHLTKITFLPIDEANTAYNGFLNGEIDWSTGIPLARIDEVKLHPNYVSGPQLGTYYYIFNVRDHATLRDARVRRAFSMAFDRKDLLDNVVKGGQIPAYSLTPPMAGYNPPQAEQYNVAAAKALLAEAGYPNGQGLPTFELVYNTLEAHKIIAEYLQQAWKNNLGINVNAVNMEWGTYLDYRNTPSMQIARAGWLMDYQDPINMMELLITGAGNNNANYSNADYDRLVRQAASMPGGAERFNVLRQAEEIGIARDMAFMPIYFYVNQNMIDLSKWDGWYQNSMDIHPYVGLKRK